MPDGIKMPLPPSERAPEQPAVIETHEKSAVEVHVEKEVSKQPAEKIEEQLPPLIPVPVQAAPPLPPPKSQLQQDIEAILAEDLKEFYASLSPQQRMHFKVEGEKTAVKIEALLEGVKIKISEIIKLIRAWLMILPGINKFFLEKEVKIKTEQILELKEEENEYR